MRCLKALIVLLALGGSLTLVACGAHPVRVQCFGPRPVSAMLPVGSSIRFSMTTVHGVVTFSVPKSAFGGAPAAMKNGDIVALCAETVGSGGQSATTITQFSDQGQPAATNTPPSR
jgi:uncharacterized Zn-binding protein involved in type VI secretion